jgi:hypothetical protein
MKKCCTVVKNRGFHVLPIECSSKASLVLSKCSLKAFSAALGASWAPLGANLEPLGRLLEPTWSLLGASWSQLGASWAQLGGSWAPLGSNFAPLGGLLSTTWRFGVPLACNLEPLRCLSDASWAQLGALGRLGSSQRHLNSTCFPSGLLLPLQADLQAQLGLHLALQTGLQEQLGLHLAFQMLT